MARKPTPADIKYRLDVYPLLRNAVVEVVSERNHLIYRVTFGDKVWAARAINPESYRRGEWISMEEEFQILGALTSTRLGPTVHALNTESEPHFLLQDYVTATCFNDLKPISEERLVAVAEAIALLNQQDISPERYPFMAKYVRRGYEGSVRSLYFRLCDSVRRMPRRDVIRWALRIVPVARRVGQILRFPEVMLWDLPYMFHFDSAHTGNTFWRNGRAIFLDWQKVSWRNDPTFTLVRFAISAGEKGVVSEASFESLIGAYLAVRKVQDFRELAHARLLERQTADLVWALWDHTRRKSSHPVEISTSVPVRYTHLRARLAPHGGQ